MTDFSYEDGKDKVRIYWQDQVVMTLSHQKAQDFLERVEDASEEEAQLIMAKLTGNFKRGNERKARNHPRNL